MVHAFRSLEVEWGTIGIHFSATEDDRLLTEENVFAIMRLMQQRGSVDKTVAEAELKDRLDALDVNGGAKRG